MVYSVPKLYGRCKENKVLRCLPIGRSCLTLQISYNFGAQRARSIFVSDRKNRLSVARAMPYAIFTSIHQKFDTRRISIIYRA